MQPLKAPERPFSHYRDGKLRGEEKPKRKWFGAGAKATDTRHDAQARIEKIRSESPQSLADIDERALAERLVAREGLAKAPRRTFQSEAHDPAPTRWAYRMERLWLTPYFWVVMRIGVPTLSIALIATIYLGDAARREAIANKFTELRIQVENRPEFMVKLMSIDGASEPVADAIRNMLPVKLPASTFALDIQGLQDAIQKIDAVESAHLQVRSGGVLAVNVVERKPAVLWRTESSLEMLDATGHRVATLLDRAARPDMPVIAGEGAEKAVPEALEILVAATPILARVRGLVRVGDRRWDIVLDGDQRIMLPEDNPVQAVEQTIAINGAEDLFARDLAVIDLRLGARPTLRLSQNAVAEMRNISETSTKVAGQ